jgi:pilus assembly protein Flp/PilA
MAQVLIRRGTVVARRLNPSVARLIARSPVAHERELRPAPVGEKGGESRLSHQPIESRRQSGQGMVEYALILVLVSIVVIVILLTMGNQIQNVFSNVVAALG